VPGIDRRVQNNASSVLVFARPESASLPVKKATRMASIMIIDGIGEAMVERSQDGWGRDFFVKLVTLPS
jgi:hypothetical protein